MTSCAEYQTRMAALFDNEAGDEDLRLVAGHLQDCAECRAFCLELVGIRRALASACPPSLSPAVRQGVLDRIGADQSPRGESRGRSSARFLHAGGLWRWAAVLALGALSIVCLALGRTARDLRVKLGSAEQQVAAIQEQAKLAESQERQQKAISALYFRMAELEERVKRGSPSQRASFPTPAYDRSARQSNL
jgi:anti-sigma factor RsiW